MPRLTTLTVPSIAAVLVAALLAAGCGSSSSDSSSSFKDDFNSQSPELQSLGQSIISEVQGASSHTNAELADSFGSLADRTQTAVDKLGDLNPPSDATSDVDTLKSSLTKVEADLKSISNAASAGSVAVAKQATTSLVVDAQQVKTAVDAVKKDAGS